MPQELLEFYDYIIVDEFHHAAAPAYQKLLAYDQPRILPGLTAAPERIDGKGVLPYFNNRIAAEIRLLEDIDRKRLCPFRYFGVTDGSYPYCSPFCCWPDAAEAKKRSPASRSARRRPKR